MNKNKIKKKILILALTVVFISLPQAVRAGSLKQADVGSQEAQANENQDGKISEITTEGQESIQNWIDGTYSISQEYGNRITTVIPPVNAIKSTSTVSALTDGGYQTAVYDDGKIYIQNYNADFQPSRTRAMQLELPIWGGMYLGKNNNYVVCGTPYHAAEEKGGEVYRIIKYDKDFNRLGSISLNGEETYTEIPFEGGNVSIDESGETLTVYTSRLRLDGHQSNIAIQIGTENMELLNSNGISDFPDIHVSHSFRQIVKYDGDESVYADVSDGSPVRSVFVQGNRWKKSVMDVAGQGGDNLTNAELSGLAISDTGYLIAGSYLNYDENNIFVSYMDKITGNVEKKWLTCSTAFHPKCVYNPKIVEIGKNRYVVMWGNLVSGSYLTEYLIIDGMGNIVSDLKSVKEDITDCEPIFTNGKIIWLSAKNGKLEFNQISDFSEGGNYTSEPEIVEAENPWDGQADTGWYNHSETEFEISTPQQLAGLAQLVNAGNTFAGQKVTLGTDISLNDHAYSHIWIPIGACERGVSSTNIFEGVFDGKKHTIYNLCTYDSLDGGLFGCVGAKGVVKSVNISQGIFNSGGCIANVNKGIIAFCNSYSMVGAIDNIHLGVGGICNENQNLVYGCKNYGEVWGDNPGGIVGMNAPNTPATISQCSNYGMVRGSGDVAGIVNYNYAWVNNCYNIGSIVDTYNGMNRAKSLSGIAYRSREGHINNCYNAGVFSYGGDELQWLSRICTETEDGSIQNCYALESEYYANADDTISENELKSLDFINKIDIQKNSVFSVWKQDTGFINGGFPITVADASYAIGECKIQPEAWILNGKKEIEVDLEQQTYDLSFQCYYSEADPVLTVADLEIAEVEKKDNRWIFQLKKSGKTQVKVQFLETENNCSAEYEFAVIVTSDGNNEPVKIEKIILSVADASLNIGKILQLQAEIFPANAQNKNLSWISDNEAVATVNNGTVYAVEPGTATITVESQDGSGIRASCIVTVTKIDEDVSSENKPGSNDPDPDIKPGGNPPNDYNQNENKPNGNPFGGNQDDGKKPGGIVPGGNSSYYPPGGSSPSVNPPNGDSLSGMTSDSTPGNNLTESDNKTPIENNNQSENPPDEQIKIEALYYVVEFNANFGTKLSRKTMTLLMNDTFGILPKVQRENYVFKGWYTHKEGGIKINRSTILNEGTIVYAQWEKVAKPDRIRNLKLKSPKTGQVAINFQKLTGAKGYEIAYSTNKKFLTSSTKKTVSVAGNTTLKKLKSGKKYYFKVRAYHLDSTGKKVYGSYSTVKSVKAK